MSALHEEYLPGGWTWSHVVKRGTALRLTDVEGGACAAALFFNPFDTSERYNMPDTLKAQFTAKLTKGHALYSDMGRVLFSVIEDEAGWHDPLGGLVDDALLERRYGGKSYQQFRNAFTRSGKRALLTELARHELGARDLTTPVNFFAKVVVDDGAMRWEPQTTRGLSVTLQAEMDVLVVLASTQHRLDPRADWEPKPVKVELLPSTLPQDANPAWAHSDQNKRGFHNSALYAL
jgi:urea carboxylase-associated protein 2